MSLTHEVINSLLSYSLPISVWSDEEQVQIKKIETVLRNIQEQAQQLAVLSKPLMTTYPNPNSSLPTSTPSQTTTADGAVPTNKQE
jgi:hypothetical protein